MKFLNRFTLSSGSQLKAARTASRRVEAHAGPCGIPRRGHPVSSRRPDQGDRLPHVQCAGQRPRNHERRRERSAVREQGSLMPNAPCSERTERMRPIYSRITPCPDPDSCRVLAAVAAVVFTTEVHPHCPALLRTVRSPVSQPFRLTHHREVAWQHAGVDSRYRACPPPPLPHA